jgi:hypothetical protein
MNYSTDSSYLCAEIKKRSPRNERRRIIPNVFSYTMQGAWVFTSSVVAAACQRSATGHASLSNSNERPAFHLRPRDWRRKVGSRSCFCFSLVVPLLAHYSKPNGIVSSTVGPSQWPRLGGSSGACLVLFFMSLCNKKELMILEFGSAPTDAVADMVLRHS